ASLYSCSLVSINSKRGNGSEKRSEVADRSSWGREHRAHAAFARAEEESRRRYRRGLELDLREQRKVLSGKLQRRDADGDLGRSRRAARSGHHLDRRPAVHAFGGHDLGA